MGKPARQSLNPYYTGIHLPILIIRLLKNVCSIGVNVQQLINQIDTSILNWFFANILLFSVI